MVMVELISRMNRILSGLMSCTIEFQPAETLKAGDWNNHELELFRQRSDLRPLFIEGAGSRCFGFPVNVAGSFAGLAVVTNWTGSDNKQLILLAELITAILEHGINKQDRAERLRLIEERLRLLDEPQNVIQLRGGPRRPGQFPSLGDIELNDELRSAPPSPLTSLPLLIQVDPGFPLDRIAIEVHQQTQRWAMIGVEDLPADIFHSREGLRELGAITLFIRDLTTLSTEQQLRLAEYLTTSPGGEMPHVIAGINESVESLIESKKVLPHLIELFCFSRLQVGGDGKTPSQVTRDFIEASLRQLLEQARAKLKNGEAFVPFHVQQLDPNQPTMH